MMILVLSDLVDLLLKLDCLWIIKVPIRASPVFELSLTFNLMQKGLKNPLLRTNNDLTTISPLTWHFWRWPPIPKLGIWTRFLGCMHIFFTRIHSISKLWSQEFFVFGVPICFTANLEILWHDILRSRQDGNKNTLIWFMSRVGVVLWVAEKTIACDFVNQLDHVFRYWRYLDHVFKHYCRVGRRKQVLWVPKDRIWFWRAGINVKKRDCILFHSRHASAILESFGRSASHVSDSWTLQTTLLGRRSPKLTPFFVR